MKDWIKKTDKDGTVRYVNPAFEKRAQARLDVEAGKV